MSETDVVLMRFANLRRRCTVHDSGKFCQEISCIRSARSLPSDERWIGENPAPRSLVRSTRISLAIQSVSQAFEPDALPCEVRLESLTYFHVSGGPACSRS